jgi:undecaprenyl diphosphate synthase
MARTASNTVLTLVVFLSYSGKWDILQAARKMVSQALSSPEKLEEIMSMPVDGFDSYLATAGIPDPDLIVRTSGENRLSNYLLWQGAYSEFLFVDTLWPDFRKKEFCEALEVYAKRDRRYGKVK